MKLILVYSRNINYKQQKQSLPKVYAEGKVEPSRNVFLYKTVVSLMHSQSAASLAKISFSFRGLSLTRTIIFSSRATGTCVLSIFFSSSPAIAPIGNLSDHSDETVSSLSRGISSQFSWNSSNVNIGVFVHYVDILTIDESFEE